MVSSLRGIITRFDIKFLRKSGLNLGPTAHGLEQPVRPGTVRPGDSLTQRGVGSVAKLHLKDIPAFGAGCLSDRGAGGAGVLNRQHARCHIRRIALGGRKCVSAFEALCHPWATDWATAKAA